MKSIFRGKTWIILLALVALAGLIVLASSLSEMKFAQPSLMALEQFLNRSDPTLKDAPANTSWFRYLIIGMLIVILLLFLGPIRPQTGKDIIKQVLRFAITMFVVALFLSRFNQVNPLLNNREQTTTPAPGASGGEAQTFTPPDVSAQSEFWITSIIIVVLGLAAIFVFNRLLEHWLAPKKDLDEIAEIARATLNELANAKESKNAIIRCYTRMNRAVDEHRGLTREVAMTPSEFATELERTGLPGEYVQSLTHIFERVRYGGQSVNPDEIKEAKRCLNGILKACEAKP